MAADGVSAEGRPPLVAIVGDLNPANSSHLLIGATLEALGARSEWVPTESVSEEPALQLSSYGGLWIAPASPYRSMDGALRAIRFARERGVPLVGT